MKKNEIYSLEIVDMSINGEGIGKVDGFPLFIKDAIIGDEIRAKVTKVNKSYGFGRVEEVINASEYRVEPRCPIARPCGGCQLQEMNYGKQLEFKERKVYEHLKRIGGFSEELLFEVTEPIIGMENPFHYRNKATFPFGRDRDGEMITGFYAGRTHNIIPNTDCHIGVSVNKEILEIIIDYMRKNKVLPYDEKTGKGILRHVLLRYGFKTQEIMVCLTVNSNKKDALRNAGELIEKLKKVTGMTSIFVNYNIAKTNVIMGEQCEVLWGERYITDVLGCGESEGALKESGQNKETYKEIKYQISPLSFYQINPTQTEKLYSLVLNYGDLKGEEEVWDLYCGIGTISLFLSQKAKKVIGVEIAPQAIADARENARINGIENVEFILGKSEEVYTQYYDKGFWGEKVTERNICKNTSNYQRDCKEKYPEMVVLDPPRKGCDETLLEAIAKVEPGKVVYVSCDSATLARDLKYLCEKGYELRRVRSVDLFPMTVHVETVALLSKLKSIEPIDVEIEPKRI